MINESGGFSAEMVETKKFIAKELTTEEEFVQFFLFLLKEDTGLATNPDTMLSVAQDLAKREIEAIKTSKNFFVSFAAFDGANVIGKGRLQITGDEEKHGFLSELGVDSAYRGKGVSKTLTDARIDYAKQKGCSYVDTHVVYDNPIGMVTKFNDGFVMTDYKYGEGQFVFSKKIDTENDFDKKKGPVGELKEVIFTDMNKIINYIEAGWVGIDIKNKHTVRDDSPDNWVLILEKAPDKV